MLKLQTRTIQLQEFEIRLLDKLSDTTGKSVEDLLRSYVRAGLIKERHDGIGNYDKLKQEAALALLEAAESQAIDGMAEPSKQGKSRKSKLGTPDPNPEPTHLPEGIENPPSLEAQFSALAEQFSLPEVTIEQIQPSESYLMCGKKQIRVIVVQQIKDETTAQYQLYNAPDQKIHNVSLKNLTSSLRGPIPPLLVDQINSAVNVAE